MARLTGESGKRVWVLLMATMVASAVAIFVALTLLWPDAFSGLNQLGTMSLLPRGD